MKHKPPLTDSSYEQATRAILEKMRRKGWIDTYVSQEVIHTQTYKWPFRVDFLVFRGDLKMVLEVQSRFHTHTWRGKPSETRRLKDENKKLHLTNAGYIWCEVWPYELKNPKLVERKILSAFGLFSPD